jgi:hypothetical protein
LISVVENRVTETGPLAAAMLKKKRITQLVLETSERPFLGKEVRPIALPRSNEAVDVLNNARFLVVRLFQEKAVVPDLC